MNEDVWADANGYIRIAKEEAKQYVRDDDYVTAVGHLGAALTSHPAFQNPLRRMQVEAGVLHALRRDKKALLEWIDSFRTI